MVVCARCSNCTSGTVMYGQSASVLLVAPGGSLNGLFACRASVTPVVRPGTTAGAPSPPRFSSVDRLLPMSLAAKLGCPTTNRVLLLLRAVCVGDVHGGV